MQRCVEALSFLLGHSLVILSPQPSQVRGLFLNSNKPVRALEPMPKLSFEPSTITVWTGEFGKYVVPTRLEGVAMASGGLTDHPFKHPMQEEFYAWVKEQDEWARLELASLASLTSKPDTTFVSALVQELITTVLEMHRAEDAYGSGFYNDDGWSSAYHKAFDLAAALSKTDTSGAKNG